MKAPPGAAGAGAAEAGALANVYTNAADDGDAKSPCSLR